MQYAIAASRPCPVTRTRAVIWKSIYCQLSSFLPDLTGTVTLVLVLEQFMCTAAFNGTSTDSTVVIQWNRKRECHDSGNMLLSLFSTERVCSNNMHNPDVGQWTYTFPTTPKAKRSGERTATLKCPPGFSPYRAEKKTLNCSDQVRWPEPASRPICGELLLNICCTL